MLAHAPGPSLYTQYPYCVVDALVCRLSEFGVIGGICLLVVNVIIIMLIM